MHTMVWRLPDLLFSVLSTVSPLLDSTFSVGAEYVDAGSLSQSFTLEYRHKAGLSTAPKGWYQKNPVEIKTKFNSGMAPFRLH